MKNRFDLANFFAAQGFKVGAEIGVAAGYFSEILCQAMPGLKLFCVDSWKRYRENQRGGNQERHDNNYLEAQQRLAPYDCHLLRDRSMKVVDYFADGCLDFVFIDANHNYEYVRDDIREWSKKVRSGGIVSGHDYYEFMRGGVIQAVDEYATAHGLTVNIIPEDPTAVRKDHRHPCWWWLKS